MTVEAVSAVKRHLSGAGDRGTEWTLAGDCFSTRSDHGQITFVDLILRISQ